MNGTREHDHLSWTEISWYFRSVSQYDRRTNGWILNALRDCPDCRSACGEILEMIDSGELPGEEFSPFDLELALSRRWAVDLWRQLEPLAPPERRRRLAEDPRYCSWGLAEWLCERSRLLASEDPRAALERAEEALICSGAVPKRYGESARSELRMLALAHQGNALRVLDQLPDARKLFRECDRIHDDDVAGIFPGYQAQVLSLRASFELDQRCFEAALSSLAEALDVFRESGVHGGELRQRIGIQKAIVLGYSNHPEKAIEVLDEILAAGEALLPSHLELMARHNRLEYLIRLERFEAVEAGLPAVIELMDRHGKPLDRLRFQWVKARLAAGRGDWERAHGLFCQVRERLTRQNLSYKAAIVTLELALLCLRRDEWPAVKELAAEMLLVFRAQEVHREALAALALFQCAALTETITEELLRKMISYMEQAQYQPHLRFLTD